MFGLVVRCNKITRNGYETHLSTSYCYLLVYTSCYIVSTSHLFQEMWAQSIPPPSKPDRFQIVMYSCPLLTTLLNAIVVLFQHANKFVLGVCHQVIKQSRWGKSFQCISSLIRFVWPVSAHNVVVESISTINKQPITFSKKVVTTCYCLLQFAANQETKEKKMKKHQNMVAGFLVGLVM